MNRRDINSNNTAILHVQFHPDDIPRKELRDIWERHCGSLFADLTDERGAKLKIENFIIAFNRPKNFRDLLSPSTLHEEEDHEVSTFFNLGETY